MRRGKNSFIAAAAVLATACATVDPPPNDLPGETIVYSPSYGPFCFLCVFPTITVAEDGRVWIERERLVLTAKDIHSNRKSVRRVSREIITVTPEQLAAFRERLAPYRPKGQLFLSDDACTTFFTDMPGTHITWRSADAEDMLLYDFGCDPETRADMRNDLVAAPGLLGIAIPEQGWAATTRTR